MTYERVGSSGNDVRDAVTSGIASGIVAGIAMGIFWVLYYLSQGLGLATIFRAISGTWFGVDALVGGGGTIVIGVASHFVAAICGGIFFSLFVARRYPDLAVWRGLAFGIVVWFAATYIVLPGIDPTMKARVAMIPGAWFISNIIYGLFLASPRFGRYAPPARARQAARERRGEEERVHAGV